MVRPVFWNISHRLDIAIMIQYFVLYILHMIYMWQKIQ